MPACVSRLCHPASAPGRCFAGALLPSCTCGWKGRGDVKPGKAEHLVLLFLQSYIRRKKEEFQLLLAGPCYTQFRCLLSHGPVSQVTQETEGPRFLLLTHTCPSQHRTLSITAYQMVQPGLAPSLASTKAEIALCLLPPIS